MCVCVCARARVHVCERQTDMYTVGVWMSQNVSLPSFIRKKAGLWEQQDSCMRVRVYVCERETDMYTVGVWMSQNVVLYEIYAEAEDRVDH